MNGVTKAEAGEKPSRLPTTKDGIANKSIAQKAINPGKVHEIKPRKAMPQNDHIETTSPIATIAR